MALLDYKISNIRRDDRHVEADIRVYRGEITTKQEFEGGSITPGLVDVTRYRRIALVRERHFAYDIPRDMDMAEFRRRARGLFNKRLVDWATANGHTVITDQQDVTDYEDMINKSEV